ncbi:hypothetical protein [Nocardia mangyaensis]|uniref:hypothetical protein n=1 Tax=Nocardia mangyaensis TaxID=2213200 RepID=UPI0026773546|nr:hypothetical protein [Nocardia mangyaensis]MDO3648746.1 hypothetical protein [Nocardia mangyaensis]
MFAFAIIDRQPSADATAVWLTHRTDTTFVRNTNAVVLQHDDPDYEKKIRSLTADHSVVLTDGTESPLEFAHAVRIDLFDDLIARTAAHQERISAAIVDYARRKRAKLVVPRFLPVPELATPERDEPQDRALAAANYVCEVWAAWLFTDEQRHRRTVTPKTQETPWIMPAELNSPTVAALPAEFADQVKPEPLS